MSFHTKFISTSPKAKFPGATHIEFDLERAYETAKQIVQAAVLNYQFREPSKVHIPDIKSEAVVGFSVETIVAALGGTLKPLLDSVAGGVIRGVAAVVGCNAQACAKVGLLLPEAANPGW